MEQNAVAVTNRGTTDLVLATREQADLQAAIMVAKRFPRDEVAAMEKVRRSFSEPDLAEEAYYSLPRGKSTIEGESVRAAEALAVAWGNIRFGFVVVEKTPEHFVRKGWALDAEANTTAEFFGQYANKVQRKDRNGTTQWVTPDELQFREMCASYGARLYRNAILRVLPHYVKAEMERACEKALTKAGKASQKELERTRALATLVRNFAALGVSVERLEAKAGRKLGSCSDEELSDLWKLGAAIKAGKASVDDHFSDGGKAEAAPAKKEQAKPNPLTNLIFEEFGKHGVTREMLEARVKKPVLEWDDAVVESMLEFAEQASAGMVDLPKEFPQLGA